MGWKTIMKQQKLVEKMTIEEKAAILSGKTVWQTREIDRLSIPSIFLSDGPNGIRKQAGAGDHLGLNASLNATCFPTAATIANSWNQDLGEEIGQALGEEAASMDVNILLGPGLNIKRSPLCGRNFFVFTVLTDAMKHISAAMQPEAMIFIQMLFKFIHKVTVKMHNLATSDAFQM